MLKTRARLQLVLQGRALGLLFWGDFPEFAVFLQAELIVGDQSGAIHIWDLKTDHNEQLIPEPEVSVNSVHIDPDASYMAAVNSSVSSSSLGRGVRCTGGLLHLGHPHVGRAPRSHIPWSFPALWWGAGSPGCSQVGATSPATDPPLSPQGNCYVWNLTGGIGEEVTQLIPKTKIPAHNRYALQCKFSPDST